MKKNKVNILVSSEAGHGKDSVARYLMRHLSEMGASVNYGTCENMNEIEIEKYKEILENTEFEIRTIGLIREPKINH